MSANESAGGALDRVQAALLLLPALLLALPGSPLVRDPATSELSATGVAALAALPALACAALGAWRVRRLSLRRTGWMLALLGVALLSALVVGGTDPLERARALLWIATGAALALGGAQLQARGRQVLCAGSAAIAALLILPALRVGAPYAGALQNTGELSNAALAGACAALALHARGTRLARWLGLALLALFVVHALLAPVVAALVALGLGAGALGLARWVRGARDGAARVLLSAALLCGLCVAWIGAGSPWPAAARPQTAGAARSAGDDLAGFGVRLSITRRTLAMASDHLGLGVGPGQFAAAFPPYRDPAEIERSRPPPGSGAETEVEHPHDDHLLVLAELGALGALLWLCFALLLARDALRAAGAEEPAELGLATGALALLVAALANGTLSFNPAASTLAFAFFGALPPRRERALPGAFAPLAMALALAAFVLFAAPSAWRIVRHGRALASFAEKERPSALELRRGLDAALDAAPDSVTAWSLRAREREKTGAPRSEVLAAWERVLELRPARIQALTQIGVIHARAGELELARGWLERAAALDPTNLGLLQNRARLELCDARLERGLELVEELRARGGASELWLRDLGAELLCLGLDREGLAVLPLADERFRALDAGRAYELGQSYRRNGEGLVADAFASHADRLFAREHAAAGRWSDARRMLRQCLRVTRTYVPEGAPRVRMELVAALWSSGLRHEAREEAQGLAPRPVDFDSLPAWVREVWAQLD